LYYQCFESSYFLFPVKQKARFVRLRNCDRGDLMLGGSMREHRLGAEASGNGV
jgi:hypothetical protein